MLNVCILTGNLGGDPEIHYSQDGSPIASFNLAFHTSAKKEDPNWIRCVSFGKLAETVEKYLHKGARIAVVGTLDQNRWVSNEDTQLCREIVRVNSDWYYVPASEGQICYKVMVSEDGREYCSCEEYTRNMKSDPILKCKHVMAVINAIKTGEFKDINYLPAIKPLLDERFITNIQGKDFVVYAGLLDLAHQMGLKKLEVNPVQYPMKDNGYEAICTAIAQTKDGVFSDIGDTNPSNCHKMVSKHILRMASTRAKARVLRDMTNVGMTCLEELEDLNEVIGNEIQKKATPRRTARKPKEDKSPPKEQTASEGKGTEEKPKDLPKEPTPKSTPKQDNAQNISEAQRRALLNLARRRNISQEELDRMVNETFHSSFDNLTQKEASQFIRQLQSAA